MKIGIIGFGRFGQIFAKYLKTEAQVVVSNRSDKSAEAERLGVGWVQGDDIFKADLLLLCVPISETKKVLAAIKDKIRPGTILADTCSVKVFPCAWLNEVSRPGIELIGLHPMFGPDSAKDNLDGKQIVLCPLTISAASLDKLTNLFKSLKLKVLQTTPAEHDRQTAISLALVHFIGRGLEGMKTQDQQVTTLGFERLLKVEETVKNDTWQLFEDMNKYNPYAEDVRLKLINNLQEINKKLNQNEEDR
jgi:prephenate dehydrogenase